MPIQTFNTNWFDQTKQPNLNYKNLPFPPFAHNTFHAQLRHVSFDYPLGWTAAISVLGSADGLPKDYEVGYLSTSDWGQGASHSPLGTMFVLGDDPAQKTCDDSAQLVKIVSSKQVKLQGTSQKIYYCETITTPAYDYNVFIANSGLLSVYPPKAFMRFSITDYLACHPNSDGWSVCNPANPDQSMLFFGTRTWGMIPAEASKAYASKAEAAAFFSTPQYLQAKQAVLSTRFDLS